MFSYNNPIVQDDLRRIVSDSLDWREFQGKSVLVTGATGMIATYVTFLLIYLNEHHICDVHAIVLCRNKDNAKYLYGSFLGCDYFSLITQDVCNPIEVDGPIDIIFHLAGNSSPYAINHSPVDIMRTNLIGTFSVMELAKQKNSKVFFASTREVYGKVEGLSSLSERDFGSQDCMEPRACYPESKRAAEALTKSYEQQYGVETYIARIAHSYGPGMRTVNDGRIMADLIGNVLRDEDVVLKSDGSAIRAFCYVTDVIRGMIYILLNGKAGFAYNLSNEDEEISIKNLAMMLSKLSKGNSKVLCGRSINQTGYSSFKRVALDNSKLYKLGWNPQIRLIDGLERTLNSEQ